MKYSLSKKTIVMITAISCVIACVAMTLGLGGNAYAEDTPVSISIDKQSMPLGDSAIFTIQVKKGEITPPQIPETEDLAIAYIGAQQESFSSFHVVIVNGQMQTTRSGGGTRYQYRVVPKRMGVLTFPSVDINVDGKVLRTNPFTIEVLEQIDLSQNVMLIQQLDKNEIYLGQGVRYTFKWYFNKDIEGYECNIPWMASLKNIVVRDPVLDQNKQYQRFVINGTDEVFADKTTETYNGQQYAVVIFEKILYPLTAGDYELTPAVLRCDVVKAYQQQRPSSFFDNFFRSDFDSFFGMGRKAITEPYSTSSAPITLVVKDVPAEGRPDAFVNAIGQYQFGVTLSSTHVKVGEPITLTMSIIGEGNLEQVDMPPLPAMDDFKGYDPESRISRKTVNGHELIKKDFQKVIIPTHAGTFSVPEIQFAYFDPQAGAYNTLKQGPFEITADKAEGYDEEIRLIAIDSDKGDNGKEIQIVKHDIHFIKTSLGDVLLREHPVYTNILLILVILLLPVLITIVLYYFNKKKIRFETDTTYAKEKTAFKMATAGIKKLASAKKETGKEFYFYLAKILSEYLGAKLHMPVASITADIADEIASKSVDSEIVIKVREFYETTDHIKYAAGMKAFVDEENKTRLLDDIRNVITRLEKEL